MTDRHIDDWKEEKLEVNAHLEELVKNMDLAVKPAGNMGGSLGDDVMSTYWPWGSNLREPETKIKGRNYRHSA